MAEDYWRVHEETLSSLLTDLCHQSLFLSWENTLISWHNPYYHIFVMCSIIFRVLSQLESMEYFIVNVLSSDNIKRERLKTRTTAAIYSLLYIFYLLHLL